MDDHVLTTLKSPSNFTISAWVKTSDQLANMASVNGSWIFWINGGRLWFEIFNDSYVKPPPPSISPTKSLVTGTYPQVFRDS